MALYVGSDADNFFTGTAGDDDFKPWLGNDTVRAGGGVDFVIGAGGDDTIYGEAGDDRLYGEGFDVHPRIFTHHRGRDYIDGGDGNDFIVGGNDGDTLHGGAGEDVMIGDQMAEAPGNATLANNPNPGDDAMFGGIGNDKMYGNEGNDSLSGEDGADWIEGGSGNDYLEGGAGNDMLIAGDGDDEVNGGAGDDTLTAGVGNDRLFGMAGFDQIYGESGDDLLVGGPGGDKTGDHLYAGDGNDRLFGADGADLFFAGAGNDELNGGGGADYMDGESGDDSYAIDNAGDRCVEVPGGGVDHVTARISIFLAANVENLSLEASAGAIDGGGNALSNEIVGNGYANTLMGQDGDDQLYGMGGDDLLDGGTGLNYMAGGFGNDTYLVNDNGDTLTEAAGQGIDTVRSTMHYMLGDNVENLTLEGVAAINATGNALDNVLRGNFANNVLAGGAGADTMLGGLGDDTYVVDQAGDVVTELAGQGNDSVESFINYRLTDNVENLKLTGANALGGYGNGLANQITGNAFDNDLAGEGGNDQLFGGEGNDHLNGGGGADVMDGGLGDDAYIVDNIGDQIVEALSGGIDHVTAHVSTALSANVDDLLLAATAGAINGAGNALSNQITGNEHANTLDGGAGADTLAGMGGDDTYIVDDVGDNVSELAGAGFDTVESGIHYTLGANFEALRLSGTTDLNGTGNALDNTLSGNAGKNILIGGDGTDTLSGGAGNDRLDGGTGADTLRGGGGNDVYIVDNTLDAIEENANEGTDSVQSSESYTLSTNVEHLTLTGKSTANATGNALNNTLTGNSAENVLSGGAGNDTLNGGGGADALLGGEGNDSFTFDALDLTLAGTRYDGGAGSDTLRFSGGGKLLDLTALADDRAFGIEIVDLTGSGNNKLAFSASDVMALSDTDALRINGNAGDAAAIVDTGWTQGADLSFGQDLYHSFFNAGATLLIDSDVASTFVS